MTGQPVATAPESGSHLLAGSCVTFVSFVLAFLAFDDISTDKATKFPLEYTCLVFCAASYLFVSAWLIRRGNRVLGVFSLVALIGAVWGQRWIGPGTVPSLKLEYVATFAGLMWLLVLSAILAVVGFQAERHRRMSHELIVKDDL